MGKSGRGWSYWSRNKLEILQGYMPAFNRAAQKSPERIYIDLMAGEPVNFDKHTKEQFDGSARLALASQPGFTRLAFGEMLPKAAKLRADLDARHPGAPFKVYPGDSNVQIHSMLADLSDVKWAPAFAFLDQQAAELHWETMCALADFRKGKTKAEQWILWSPAMIVKGVTGTNKDKFAAQVDRLYGSADWRKILAARFESEQPITAGEFRAEMVNLLRWQFEKQLGYAHTIRIPMKMANGTDLYDMVFATDHEAGLKIMSYLYQKAAEREPKMKEEALQAQSGQGALFDVAPAKVPEWKSEPCWDPTLQPWW
ncbi:three-Cys-motif partner protein [Nocardioides aromaticivorans]|uniref:Three-Cys-motif partner protein n=1 Tax=Nocardioides aromaticivorans TaxID=200618 RepID=A0A7Y9ZLU1_9ACTN|nr:three-Cys-motif partner protein TcmP [Nocardioides aromaticivorans]NYI47859.1 three-Cys-motif partner protein [Nocardioides aromaticivorans]